MDQFDDRQVGTCNFIIVSHIDQYFGKVDYHLIQQKLHAQLSLAEMQSRDSMAHQMPLHFLDAVHITCLYTPRAEGF